jgi:hypothetical protein
MNRIISFRLAGILAVLLFSLFVVFHLSVIIGILLFDFIPIDFLWGGNMESREQLLGFEFVSLAVMAFCLFTVLIKTGRINLPGMQGIAGVFLWILFGLFLLNTVGNFLAKTAFEKTFAVFTLLLAFLCLRLALEPRKS